MAFVDSAQVEDFISRWSAASPSECAKPADVAEILETLVTLGRAHKREGGLFAP